VRVQRVRLPGDGKVTWMVLGDDLLPVEPIQKYLSYIENLQKSPNTIQSYAYHLKLFWEFLRDSRLDWKDLPLEKRAEFIHWLRSPDPRVVYLQQQQSKRTERTINTIMAAVYSFYEFQEQIGATETVETYHYQYQPKRKYKSLLHHINKSKPVKKKLLKLKEPKAFPGTLSREQVKQLKEQLSKCRQDAKIQTNSLSDFESQVAFLNSKTKKSSTISNKIKSELTKIGIDLNTTLTKTIKSATEELVLSAIEALKVAMTTGNIERPGGWLNKAIKDGWILNEKHLPQDQVTRDIFKEWFNLAYKQRLVLASTLGDDGQIYVYTLDGVSLPFQQMLTEYPLERLLSSL
jgi:integrase